MQVEQQTDSIIQHVSYLKTHDSHSSCLQTTMLWALYLLSKVSFAKALQPAPPGETCNDIHDCRTLYDIIFGCVATIFACTWVSVHPNVPPPGLGVFKRTFRRLSMMLVAIIAPEIVVFFAARQFMFARRFAKEFNKIDKSQSDGIDSEMSSTEAPSQNVSVLDIETQHQSIPMECRSLLRPWHLFGSPPSAEESEKKRLSKAHGFFFAMGGFVSHGGFPITTLRQISGKSDAAKDYRKDIRGLREEEIEDRSKGDALSKGLALLQVLWFITQCIGRQIQHLPITALEIATIAFAVMNIFIWLLWWNKPLGMGVPIRIGPQDVMRETLSKTDLMERIIGGPLVGEYTSYSPEHSTSVPLFWSSGDEGTELDEPVFLFEMFVGSVFGGIHCLGWNSEFPSFVESVMWKVAAAFITVVALTWVVFIPLMPSRGGSNYFMKVVAMSFGSLAFFGLPVYFIARLCLLVLPLTSLRNLHAGAFQQIDWTVYLPHL
ncbi:hypothetical protein C8J56DRAFT_824057 [Mycena floridula]|nr:hypothetical protein C8J56DRAFT_824057 [Mycena floridula]